MSERPPRVLLVEDDVVVRDALRDMLSDMGMEIVGEAGTGGEGVSLARERDPDVVLMDIRMPEMGGLEATRIIKESQSTTQVVILTAYEDPALQQDAAESGVFAYLIKGCPARVVSQVAAQAAEMRRGLEEQRE